MGNLYLHTHIGDRNTDNMLELCATLVPLFLMLSTIPCHLQLPLCLLLSACQRHPDDSLAAERSHLPVLGSGEWRAVRVGVLHSHIRYALNLSPIQGHIVSYLRVITTLFFPKKLNVSKVNGAGIFPLHF